MGLTLPRFLARLPYGPETVPGPCIQLYGRREGP
ncbi:hypothetical protein [Paraburkholderia nemoris]